MKLVILERDGVINEIGDQGIVSPDDWRPIPGSLDAIARLNRAGFRVVVATNQPGVARGAPDLDTLHAIHARMQAAIAESGGVLDGIYFCPHAENAGCDCRMPAPGLLLEIARRVGGDLSGTPAISDSLEDLQAAADVGAVPVLVRSGRGLVSEAALGETSSIPIFDNLSDAADQLLTEQPYTEVFP